MQTEQTCYADYADPFDYANLWGSTASPAGRLMYSTADQAADWTRKEWADFLEAIADVRAAVVANPERYETPDDDTIDLTQLAEWAAAHYVAA